MFLDEPDDVSNELSNLVLGAAIEVHRVLGPGFREKVYERALCIELERRGIPFEKQRQFFVDYKGRRVGHGQLDLLVGGRLILELKSMRQVPHVDLAQAIAYLKANDLRLALIINFNVTLLRDGVKRVVFTPRPRAA